jgi:hypothetical protein
MQATLGMGSQVQFDGQSPVVTQVIGFAVHCPVVLCTHPASTTVGVGAGATPASAVATVVLPPPEPPPVLLLPTEVLPALAPPEHASANVQM